MSKESDNSRDGSIANKNVVSSSEADRQHVAAILESVFKEHYADIKRRPEEAFNILAKYTTHTIIFNRLDSGEKKERLRQYVKELAERFESLHKGDFELIKDEEKNPVVYIDADFSKTLIKRPPQFKFPKCCYWFCSPASREDLEFASADLNRDVCEMREQNCSKWTIRRFLLRQVTRTLMVMMRQAFIKTLLPFSKILKR